MVRIPVVFLALFLAIVTPAAIAQEMQTDVSSADAEQIAHPSLPNDGPTTEELIAAPEVDPV
jgi:hypothetical protein